MWKLKLDSDGKAVLDAKGNPVWVDESGKERSDDLNETLATVVRLNGEAMGSRQAREKPEKDLTAFAGIKDVTAALAALETVAALDPGGDEAKTTARIEQMKVDLTAQFDDRFKKQEDTSNALRSENDGLILGHAFGNSPYIKDKLAVPADMVQSLFAGSFKTVDGKPIVEINGAPMQSTINIGTPATFDESVEALVDGYAHKNSLLKGNNNSGSGSGGGNDVNAGKHIVTRAEFDKMGSASAAFSQKVKEGKAAIVENA